MSGSSSKHDLMAPLCNIRAFNEELKHVASVLQSLADGQSGKSPEELSRMCGQLANDDIIACTDAISRASDTLEEKILRLLDSTAVDK